MSMYPSSGLSSPRYAPTPGLYSGPGITAGFTGQNTRRAQSPVSFMTPASAPPVLSSPSMATGGAGLQTLTPSLNFALQRNQNDAYQMGMIKQGVASARADGSYTPQMGENIRNMAAGQVEQAAADPSNRLGTGLSRDTANAYAPGMYNASIGLTNSQSGVNNSLATVNNTNASIAPGMATANEGEINARAKQENELPADINSRYSELQKNHQKLQQQNLALQRQLDQMNGKMATLNNRGGAPTAVEKAADAQRIKGDQAREAGQTMTQKDYQSLRLQHITALMKQNTNLSYEDAGKAVDGDIGHLDPSKTAPAAGSSYIPPTTMVSQPPPAATAPAATTFTGDGAQPINAGNAAPLSHSAALINAGQPTVNSQQDYDALKAGQTYTWNGKQYTKGK